MKIGISELYTGMDGRDRQWMIHSAQLIENLGFNSLWMSGRVLLFPEYDTQHPYAAQNEIESLRWVFDGLVALPAISMVTQRIRLGTYVELLSLREPLITARAVATADQMSGGRFDFGVGVGWLKEEHEAFGVPWETRGARVTEYLQAMKHIWTTELSEFHGRFIDFPTCYIGPKPVQKPHPPICIGGNSPGAMKRLVTLGDRWIGYGLTVPEVAKFVEKLHADLETAGRDPAEVMLSIGIRFAGVDGARKSAKVDHSIWDDTLRYIEGIEKLGLEELVISSRIPLDGYEDNMSIMAERLGVKPETRSE
jgi:probable F420-dependent oxidoreductase